MKKTFIFVPVFVLVLLLLSLIFITNPLGAARKNIFESATQTNAARTSLNLEGGPIEDLAVAPNQTVYAAVNSANGIYAAKKGATSWSGPSAGADVGSVSDVEVDSSSNAYILGGIKLYKSTDDGQTWTELTAGRGDYDQTMLYAQNKLIVPSRNGSIDISTDGGQTFTNATVASGQRISSLASSTTGVFYALVGEGSSKTLYKSTDSGASWSSTGKSGNYTVVGANSAGTVVLAGSPGAEYSTDGSSWSSMGNPSGSSHVTFSGSRVYIGNSWTNNNGATWHNIQNEASSYSTGLTGNAFAIDSINSNVIYISSDRGVAKTTDGGANWHDFFEGMNGIFVDDITQADNKNVVWVAAYGGFGKTTNFTSTSPTWTYPIRPSGAFGSTATAVWINPDNSNIVLAGGAGLIYRSTDGGSTWSAATESVTLNITDFEATSNNSSIYASYASSSGDAPSGGVLVSTDGGSNWTDTGLLGVPVNAIAIGSDGSVYAGAGMEFNSTASTRGIYKYSGSSWSQLSGNTSGLLINDVLIVGSTIYAASGETNQGGIFVSNNGGTSWAELKGGLPSDGWFKSITSETGVPSTLYVATGRPAGTSYIYKSMDSGASWGKFYTGLTDEAFNTLLFDGLVGGSDTGLYSYKSKASITLRAKRAKKNRYNLATTLKDAATKKALKKRLIKLYKKVIVKKKIKKKWKNITKWKLVAKKKTNNKGQLSFSVGKGKKKNTYQARWSPVSKRDKTNYKAAKSKNVKIST